MKKFSLFTALFFTFITVSMGQLTQTVETCYNVQGTYTDLGNSGTVINTANYDDANSAAQPIGFNFDFNGSTFSYFVLNTNGFIKLGPNSSMSAPSAANLAYTYFNQNNPGGVFSSSNVNDRNILAAFNHDLDSSSTAQTEYRYSTTGSAGSRILTVQFKNVTDKNITDTASGATPQVQFSSMNFQIKLYEANDMIEFVYGDFIPTSDTSLFKLAGVGIKGSSNTQIINVSKSSSYEWHVAGFNAGNYTGGVGVGFNFGNNNTTIGKVIPTCVIRPLVDNGRTFRFLPQIANDAEVTNVIRKHATVIPWGDPHPISVRVTNVGTASKTGTWVKVKITGANSYQDSSIINAMSAGVASTVNFTGYTPQNIGTDIINVSLSSDGENSNNEKEYIQLVGRELIGYSDSTGNVSNFGWGSGNGIFAARYRVTGKRKISRIQMKIGFNTASVGQSIYGVVVDNGNNIVGRTPNYVIQCGDMGKWVDLEVFDGNTTNFDRPPPTIANNQYYVGMAILTAGHYPMALQSEDPTPSGAYYYHGGLASGGTYTDLATTTLNVYRLPVNSTMDGVSLKLEPVTSLNDPSCAISNQTVEVTVTNQDSITVDFAIDTLHLEVSSTGAINQTYSRLINSGTLDPDSSTTFVITNNFDLSVGGQYDVVIEARQWLEVDTANNYQTFTVNVVDTPDVTLDVVPDSVICYGVPFTFIANPYTAGSAMYQWKVNGLNQGNVTSDSSFSPSIDWGDTVSVDLITDHCTTGTFTIPSNQIVMQINPKPKFINGITGIDSVVRFTDKNYSAGIQPGHTYLWKVSGGTIVTDSTGAAVKIEWGDANLNASVSLEEKDANGCERTHVLPVHVLNVDGINELSGLTIGDAFPNPADNTVNIPVKSNKAEQISIALYDLTGKKVRDIFEGQINGEKTFRIDVSDLKEGMYIYKVRTTAGYEQVNRLTIRH